MVTVITKTIGAGGGYDYATFTAAEADVTNIATTAFGSTDLVANDGAIVFEAVAGTYSESVTFSSTLTTDATRNVTYKPAAGSEHGGSPDSGVIIDGSGSTAATISDDFVAIQGINLRGNFGINSSASGIQVFDVFVQATGTYGGLFSSPSTGHLAAVSLANCVFLSASGYCVDLRGPSSSGSASYSLRNCTLFSVANGAIRSGVLGAAGTTTDVELVNNLSFSVTTIYPATGSGTVNYTGSNNFGGSTNPFPVAIQGSPYPITPTTSFSTPLGSGDYAVYMGATGALANVTGNDVWQQGVGPASNPDVPTTDINGVTRSGTSCNPGAFEADGFVAPTVITKTIGAAGPPTYDYASFTLAENAVTSIGTGTDLTFYNEAIVFEAVAGTYSESVTFSSTLTSDATRQVTYKPASGSEHGGVFGAGVNLSQVGSVPQYVNDDYLVFDGIQFTDNQNAVNPYWTGRNVIVRNCLASLGESSDSRGLTIVQENGLSDPIVFENCVAKLGSAICAFYCRAYIGTGTSSIRLVNCTVIGNAPSVASYASTVVLQTRTGGYDVSADIYNVIDLTPGPTYLHETPGGAGVLTLTGSNNFGSATNPFPVAIQGVPYPITPTTDVDPGPGDWAIYDAATGALIDDPDNDVLAGGIGPDANPDVPTTDILGNTRSGATTDPGAFEISTLAPPEPALITIMRQIYQQDASFSVGASSAGVEKITHQLGPASADYFTINSTTSATVSVPRTAHALRVICVVAAKACDVTLDLDASNSVFLGSIGGVASVQTDLTYFWSFGQVVSDGTYPRVRIVNDGFAGDQLVYLWWHLA